MLRIIVIVSVFAGIGVWPAMSSADSAQTDAARFTLHKRCIEEPVFEHTACIYEANPEAAETVVLVHGLNGRAERDWGGQIPELAKQFHVLSFDLPGFGDSDKDGRRYSPKRYARFIHFVTQRYARRPFYLVGHSMGGAIVLRYSGTYPQDVKRLVLVDVAGVLHRMAYARLLAAAWLENNARYGKALGGIFDRMAYKFITKIEGVSGVGNDYLARKLLEYELVDADPAVIAAYTLANEDLGDTFKAITMPTLLLWGEEDIVAPLRTTHVLKAHLPQSRLETIPAAGHSPMVEVPAVFNTKLLRFLLSPETVSPITDEAASPAKSVAADVTCQNRRGEVYEGVFERLTLNGCRDVVIRNAHIGQLFVGESVVAIENSRIGTKTGTGLIAIGAELTVTASTISGEVAIHASRSRLDLAAVALESGKTTVTGNSGSSLIFSVSTLSKGDREQRIHGYYEVDANEGI